MSADQIEQREQEYPHNIDKVPVQPKVLDKRYVTVRIRAGSRTKNHEA
jgi:hypothetical protein